MIKNVLISIFLFLGLQAVAQQDPVLMRINGQEVSRSEYEYFTRTLQTRDVGAKKTPAEGVDLFVNFKLKVLAAQAVGMDTTRTFREALEVYRRQLVQSYLTDEVGVERMARQYYEQMKTDKRAARVLVSHIFKKLPQNVSGYTLRSVQARMDSVYGALQKAGSRADFDGYVKRFSDEKKAFWMGWLQMPVEFEETVAGLQIGEVSRPFFTPLGIHIVKVLERKEILPFEEMKEELIRRHFHHYGRDEATEGMVEKLKKEHHFAFHKEGVNELLVQGTTAQTLFTLAGKAYTGKEFARFALAHPGGVQHQLDGFVMKSVLGYEASSLEQNSPEFKLRMQSHRDHRLLDAITVLELGHPSQASEAALKAYFEQHRSDYSYKAPRYKGIVLHCTTQKVAKQVRKFLKRIPENEWMNAIRLTFNAAAQPQVQAQQGSFAQGDNLFIDELVFKAKDAPAVPGFPVTVVLGKKVKGPEDYQEVRSALVTDYQNDLEARWNARLRAVSKVEINQEVLKTVNNH